jgi:hypothetical protein
MRRYILKILSLTVVLFIITVYPQGRSIGIFVDGGFSPGKNDTEMDKMMDKRVKDAMDAMKEKDKDAEVSKIEHKADLIKKLASLHCVCGDEIVLYMAGHGENPADWNNSPAFHFIKDGTDQIKPDELRRALQKAADSCCCKISVVMFSCYSGNFVNELFNDPHVVSVFVSSSSREMSYTDAYRKGGRFVDGGDWAGGFDEDWKASKKKKIVEQLMESSESAKEKMPDKFAPDEHPQGWVRGEIEIYGHVEQRWYDGGKPPRINKLKVHFYEPDFLRCTHREIDVKDINVSDTVKECVWVRFKVRTGKPTDPIKGISDVVITEAPREEFLAHILEVDREKGFVKVYVISPKWMHGRTIKVKVEKPGSIDSDLRPCNWTRITVKVIDPDNSEKGFVTTDPVRAQDQTFNCHIHIEKLDRSKNEIDIHILQPPWLKCQIHNNVPIPVGEINRLDGLDKCDNINADVTIHPNGTVGIRNINALTNAEGARHFSLDAAVQKVNQFNFDSTGILFPVLNVTNVGEETISFSVYVAIAKPEELSLLQQWWQTGQGTPQCLYYEMKTLENLLPAETRAIDFTPWQISGEQSKYWVGFRTVLAGDENPASDTTSAYLSLQQHQQNTPPQLLNPSVQPQSGMTQTPFVFQVIYKDSDGDEPVLAEVKIDDNQSIKLLLGQGTVTEGRTYYLQTNLPSGMHTFYFKFDDGHGNVVTTNVINGPMVQ